MIEREAHVGAAGGEEPRRPTPRAPSAGRGTSPEFARARLRYVALELVATGLLGAIMVLGVLV